MTDWQSVLATQPGCPEGALFCSLSCVTCGDCATPPPPVDVVNLFGGPGGWDLALDDLGLSHVGVEWSPMAVRTRGAAGHPTVYADVAAVPLAPLGSGGGAIASPPCQSFSSAGDKAGRDDLPALLAEVHRWATDGWRDPSHRDWLDDRTPLVLQVLRMIDELQPEWVACEQVPSVLPLWQAIADALLKRGWASAHARVLCAADYGTPQKRNRAILWAHRTRVVGDPVRTHAPRDQAEQLGLTPWVSMAEALGWGYDHRPAPTQTGTRSDAAGGSHAREALKSYRRNRGAGITERHGDRQPVPATEPAPTVTGHARSDEWVLDRGTSSGFSRDGEPYTGPSTPTPIDQPSTTVTGQTRSWVLRPGSYADKPNGNRRDHGLDEPAPTLAFAHDSAGWRWLNTGRDWKPGGTREDCQRIPTEEPAPALTGKSGGQWWLERPATTVQGDPRIWPPGHKINAGDVDRLGQTEAQERYGDRAGTEAVRVTLAEALTLQGFPADYPVAGNVTESFQQVGDAVPPQLARAVIAALLG